MVNDQEILDLLASEAYKPLTYQELEKQFHIDSAQDFKELVRTLNALEDKGLIMRDRADRYGLPERMNLLRGRMQAHAKGFGFLIPEDREHPDVYVNAGDMKGAMNGDTVLVRITMRGAAGGKLEGEVVRIVERAINQVVGTFQNLESYGFVVPDDKRLARDIFVPKDAFMGAVTGQKVVARIVNYPEGRAAAEAEIIEILGHKDDPGVDILSIIRQFQLPESFPEEVLAEAEKAPDTIEESELVGRRDLRGETIVTIDGADAKDLDDAVNVKKLENGNYYLGVHIADVSYYVRENSELDKEAYNRGTSVYLVDRVIPMLPHRLSNGICSLNPKVDRLTMSCEMEINAQGDVVKHDIFTSVIRTTERMTYSDVRKIVEDRDPEVMERYTPLVDNFLLMEELARLLRGKRMKRGAVDFNFQEAKILVDEAGKPTEIIKREQSIAEQIIEEFMLKANETVAEHFHWLKVPFLYRIHEEPDSEKLLRFAEFITAFGHALKGGQGNKIHPRSLQTILEEVKETKEEAVISKVLLRSMKQARYDAQSTGHFGLAAEFYSHFTSPIRRYPDLIIHRVIREVLESGGTLSDKRFEYLASRMDDYAKQSSERERLAVEAERETDALKKAEFMLDKVGEEFDGIISGVTGFGMFVELANTVEGLVRLGDLTDDFYNLHEAQHMLVGERTGRTFRLGDEIKVRVAKVNLDERNIDFELLDMKKREGGFRGGRGGERGIRSERGGKSGERSARGGKGRRGGDAAAVFSGGAAAGGGKRKRGAKAAGEAVASGGRKAASGSGAGGVAASGGKRKRRGKGGAGAGVPAALGAAAEHGAGRRGVSEAGGSVAAGAAAGSGRGKRGQKRKPGAGGAAFAASALGERVLASSGAAGGLGDAGGEVWHNAGSLNSERGGTGSGRKGKKRKHREREAGGGDVGISSVAGANAPAPRAAQTAAAKAAAAEQPSSSEREPAGASPRGKRKDGLGGGFAVGPGTVGRSGKGGKSGGRGRREEAPGVQFYGGAAAAWATAGRTAETPKTPAPAAEAASVSTRKRKTEKPQAAMPIAEENKVSRRKRKTEKPQAALPVAQEAAPKRKPKRAKSSQTDANNTGSGEGAND